MPGSSVASFWPHSLGLSVFRCGGVYYFPSREMPWWYVRYCKDLFVILSCIGTCFYQIENKAQLFAGLSRNYWFHTFTTEKRH